MSAHVELAPQWQAFAASTPSVTVSEGTREEAPPAKGRGFMRGWSSEERHFAIGSVILAGVIPGFGGIVVALANHFIGSGITP